MGGSGGGSYFGRSTDEVTAKLRESIAQAKDAEFEAAVSARLASLLAQYNARNTQETGDRLAEIKECLADVLGGTVDTLFGGSVAKHTYVDGISDVDSLLILDKTDAKDKHPQELLDLVRDRLAKALAGKAVVSSGSVAVTVRYADGTELQLVPARRVEDKLEVPAWQTNSWAHINPQQFQNGLTKRNKELGSKVIPTIKLAKAICGTLPEELRPSGYHLESLAVAAFRDYSGELSSMKMLSHFFDQSRRLVLEPMRDRTGQSVHVDENLGDAHSPARQRVSLALDRIARRIAAATATMSLPRWMELFGE